jgi:hypothetical protein
MDAIVKAIQARPGVVSTPPLPVTIGGYDGRMLDISISPSWTGGCVAPDGSATTIGIPLLVEAGTELGPVIGIGPGLPVRLILVDLGDERTMSIAIFGVDPLPPASFAKQVEAAMPVIESFELHPPTP